MVFFYVYCFSVFLSPYNAIPTREYNNEARLQWVNNLNQYQDTVQ